MILTNLVSRMKLMERALFKVGKEGENSIFDDYENKMLKIDVHITTQCRLMNDA